MASYFMNELYKYSMHEIYHNQKCYLELIMLQFIPIIYLAVLDNVIKERINVMSHCKVTDHVSSLVCEIVTIFVII